MAKKTGNKGFTLAVVIAATGLFIAISIGMIELGVLQRKLYKQQAARSAALHFSENGILYYRWILAHYQTEYMDLSGSDPTPGLPYGPYLHSATSTLGNLTGKYQLEITPPDPGTTIVTIKSTGWTDAYPNVKRTIVARFGQKSLARYTLATDESINIAGTENIKGEYLSNNAIIMEGLNDSYIYSGINEYDVTSAGSPAVKQSNCNTCIATYHSCRWDDTAKKCYRSGISNLLANTQTNRSYWRFPIDPIDFPGFTQNLNAMYNIASNTIHCINCSANPPNNNYHITFLANGTYEVYRVTALAAVKKVRPSGSGCEDSNEIISSQSYLTTNSIPDTGVIFVVGNVWIEGTVNGRVTIVAAKLPENPTSYKNIYINGNITYNDITATSSLAIIAQENIIFPREIGGLTDVNVHASLLAQYGKVFRYDYGPCLSGSRAYNSITFLGGTISRLASVLASGADGFQTIIRNYDPRITYNPPPYFPTESGFTFLSWSEVSD